MAGDAQRVVIAADKLRGTLSAAEAGTAIARGWRRRRPEDELVLVPMADGGDGTAQVIAAARPVRRWVSVPSVNAVGLPVTGRYLLLDGHQLDEPPGEVAVVELAEICGLAPLAQDGSSGPEPMRSHTVGLGIVLAAAIRAGARRVIVAVGGSASTDGGAGALSALGMRLVGRGGVLPIGGGGLANLARVDRSRMLPPPAGGVDVLVDVDSPLTGPSGAAAVFGPQKGASPAQVAELDRALGRFGEVLAGAPDAPGAGAAGGTGYGLACWGARLVPGSAAVAQLTGLPEALRGADLLITGEGRYDHSSAAGKVTGYLRRLGDEQGLPVRVVAGSVADGCGGAGVFSAATLAGSAAASMRDAAGWLARAAERAAADRSQELL